MKNIAKTSKRETTGWQLRPTENISKNYSYGRTASAIKYQGYDNLWVSL